MYDRLLTSLYKSSFISYDQACLYISLNNYETIRVKRGVTVVSGVTWEKGCFTPVGMLSCLNHRAYGPPALNPLVAVPLDALYNCVFRNRPLGEPLFLYI